MLQARMNIECNPNVDSNGTCMSVVREYVGSGFRIIANVQSFYPDDVAPIVGRIYQTQSGYGRVVWADGTTYDHKSFSAAQDSVSE